MKLRFRSKLFLAFFFVSVLLIAVVIWQVYNSVHVIPTMITRETLMAAADNSARNINPALVAAASKKLEDAMQQARRDQPGKKFSQTQAAQTYKIGSEYLKLLDQMKAIDKASPHFGTDNEDERRSLYLKNEFGYEKDVYILIRTSKEDIGRIIVCIDPDTIGEEYKMSDYPTMVQGWKETAAEHEITADSVHKSTMTLGAWSPVLDASGQAVALLGINAPAKPIDQFSNHIILAAIWIFSMTVVLSIIPAWYLSWRLNRPIKLLSEGMENIRAGKMDIKIPVVKTGDEFEELVENFNEMAAGLGERDVLRESLILAGEIQEHLLPLEMPKIPGFDIFGAIDYCDESGGDYYDFIKIESGPQEDLGIAIGDVTGHGIGAALLMATGRALLRSHAQHRTGSIVEMFDDINQHMVRDTGDEFFMTLFYTEFSPATSTFQYASAGHDPVLWYHAATGQFDKLGNTGIPLGIIDDFSYGQSERLQLEPGDLLVMSTDGIREANNPQGEMFGEKRLIDTVQANLDKPACEIHDTIIQAVRQFQAGQAQADDITLVILKCL